MRADIAARLTRAGQLFDLVGFGECSMDEVWRLPAWPTPGDKLRARGYERLGGGQIATATVAAARLGLRTAFVGTVGHDAAGQEVIDGLAQEGVEVAAVQRHGTTRVALILVDPAGERTVIANERPAAPRPPLLGARLEATRVVHLDASDPAHALWAAKRAREAGAVVSLDLDHLAPGLDQLLPLVDLCLTARGLPQQLTGEPDLARALALLTAQSGALCGCTLGDAGAALYDEGHLVLAPAFPLASIVDTTACGDTFHAAFVCALLEAQTPAQALRFANAAAALKCRDLGRRGCPTRAEVDALLAAG